MSKDDIKNELLFLRNRLIYIKNKIFVKTQNYYTHIKTSIHIYKRKALLEIKETNEMVELILKKVILGTATDKEIIFVKNKGVNVVKLISSGTIVALPGGIIIMITLQKLIKKFFKKEIFPDTFVNKSEAELINEKYNDYAHFISHIEILEEESKGYISPIFEIEKIYIKSFKYNEKIYVMKNEQDIERYELIYFKNNDLNDYLLVLKKYIYKNNIK
jgi:hypothetical protein